MGKQGRSVHVAEGQAGLMVELKLKKPYKLAWLLIVSVFGHQMSFKNENNVELCQAEWRLTFREDRVDFVDQYFVKFTPEGIA